MKHFSCVSFIIWVMTGNIFWRYPTEKYMWEISIVPQANAAWIDENALLKNINECDVISCSAYSLQSKSLIVGVWLLRKIVWDHQVYGSFLASSYLMLHTVNKDCGGKQTPDYQNTNRVPKTTAIDIHGSWAARYLQAEMCILSGGVLVTSLTGKAGEKVQFQPLQIDRATLCNKLQCRPTT